MQYVQESLLKEYTPELVTQHEQPQEMPLTVMVPLVRRSGKYAETAKRVRTPEDCYATLEGSTSAARELFQAIYLDSKNYVISSRIISIGILDSCLVHPREVFYWAVQHNAAAVIVAHNHPSGDCTPSSEDVRITKSLIDAGRILDIKLLDHVVIGPRDRDGSANFISLREQQICSFA